MTTYEQKVAAYEAQKIAAWSRAKTFGAEEGSRVAVSVGHSIFAGDIVRVGTVTKSKDGWPVAKFDEAFTPSGKKRSVKTWHLFNAKFVTI